MLSVNNTFSNLDKGLAQALSNPYVSTILIILALIFATMATPTWMMNSTLFKFLCLLLILVLLKYNIIVAVIVALAFVLAFQKYRTYGSPRTQDIGYNPGKTNSNALNNSVSNTFGDITNLGNNALNAVGYAGSAGSNLLNNLGSGGLNLSRDVVNAPNQLFSSLGNTLTNLPSSFSTPLGQHGGENAPSMLNMNTGCPVPTSCQKICGSQPMPPTALPPYENTEVTGLCSCDSEGPQGLRFPPGYEDVGMGYRLGFN